MHLSPAGRRLEEQEIAGNGENLRNVSSTEGWASAARMNPNKSYLVMGKGLLQTTERTLTPTPDSETLFLLMAEKLSLLLGSHESILSPVQSEEHLRLSQERGLPQEGVGSRDSLVHSPAINEAQPINLIHSQRR